MIILAATPVAHPNNSYPQNTSIQGLLGLVRPENRDLIAYHVAVAAATRRFSSLTSLIETTLAPIHPESQMRNGEWFHQPW